MTRRKKIKTGIGILLVGILLWQFGLFHRFNYLTAKIDILNENPRIVDTGPPMNFGVPVISLNEKYGFYQHNTHCTGSGAKFNGIDAYNSEVEKYLKKRNGENWRKKYQAELNYLIENNLTE